jgi:hypothetical protein
MNVTDRKGFIAAAAAAVGATGVVATPRPAEASSTHGVPPPAGGFETVTLTDQDPDFNGRLAWHLGPGGYTLLGYSVYYWTQFALLGKRVP